MCARHEALAFSTYLSTGLSVHILLYYGKQVEAQWTPLSYPDQVVRLGSSPGRRRCVVFMRWARHSLSQYMGTGEFKGARSLSSAEVQAFVISIRCAKCTAGTKSNGSNSLPALRPGSYVAFLPCRMQFKQKIMRQIISLSIASIAFDTAEMRRMNRALHYSADPPHLKKNPLSLCGGERG